MCMNTTGFHFNFLYKLILLIAHRNSNLINYVVKKIILNDYFQTITL